MRGSLGTFNSLLNLVETADDQVGEPPRSLGFSLTEGFNDLGFVCVIDRRGQTPLHHSLHGLDPTSGVSRILLLSRDIETKATFQRHRQVWIE